MLGAWEVKREVRRVDEISNHLLMELGVGLAGQGSVVKVSSAFSTALTTVTESPSYRLFTPTTLTLVTHNLSHVVL